MVLSIGTGVNYGDKLGYDPRITESGKVRGHSVNCKTFEIHLTSFQMMDLRRKKLEHAAERKEDEHRGTINSSYYQSRMKNLISLCVRRIKMYVEKRFEILTGVSDSE